MILDDVFLSTAPIEVVKNKINGMRALKEDLATSDANKTSVAASDVNKAASPVEVV